MKNKPLVPKLATLNSINEEINFLENLGSYSAIQEESLEELRTIRYEIEKELKYDKVTAFKNDQADREES